MLASFFWCQFFVSKINVNKVLVDLLSENYIFSYTINRNNLFVNTGKALWNFSRNNVVVNFEQILQT